MLIKIFTSKIGHTEMIESYNVSKIEPTYMGEHSDGCTITMKNGEKHIALGTKEELYEKVRNAGGFSEEEGRRNKINDTLGMINLKVGQLSSHGVDQKYIDEIRCLLFSLDKFL